MTVKFVMPTCSALTRSAQVKKTKSNARHLLISGSGIHPPNRANHGFGVAAGGGSRRFLVLQYEAATPTDCCAGRTHSGGTFEPLTHEPEADSTSPP